MILELDEAVLSFVIHKATPRTDKELRTIIE
jgi:hypothetical protein